MECVLEPTRLVLDLSMHSLLLAVHADLEINQGFDRANHSVLTRAVANSFTVRYRHRHYGPPADPDPPIADRRITGISRSIRVKCSVVRWRLGGASLYFWRPQYCGAAGTSRRAVVWSAAIIVRGRFPHFLSRAALVTGYSIRLRLSLSGLIGAGTRIRIRHGGAGWRERRLVSVAPGGGGSRYLLTWCTLRPLAGATGSTAAGWSEGRTDAWMDD